MQRGGPSDCEQVYACSPCRTAQRRERPSPMPQPDLEELLKKLRASARKLIDAGKLPATTKPYQTIGDCVTRHEHCRLCDKLMESTEFMPGEARYMISPEARGPSFGPLHFLCHAAWQIEAAEAEQQASLSGPERPGRLATPSGD